MKQLMKKIMMASALLLMVFTIAACDGFIEFQDENGESDDDSELKGNTLGTSQYFDSFVQANIFHTLSDEEFEEVTDQFHTILNHLHEVATSYDKFEITKFIPLPGEHHNVGDDVYLYEHGPSIDIKVPRITNVKVINESPGVWHEVDEALFDMIMTSIDYYDYTNGYFDISLGPVIDIWNEYSLDCDEFLYSIAGSDNREQRMEEDYSDYCRVPSTEELEAANEHVGIDKIEIDEANQRIKIKEGMRLDLGGIGKGYAAKVLGDYLKTVDGIESFLVNAGTSNVEVYGDHPYRENKLWYTGVTNPDTPNDPTSRIASLQITSGDNVTTSGDYQRYYEVDGRKYHHLINPNTLFPTDHHSSVTMVSSDGEIGDILVTAVFVMPLDEGLEFVNTRSDIEALWYIDEDTVVMSDNFEENYIREFSLDGVGDDSGQSNDNFVLLGALFLPGILLIIFSVLTLLYKKGIIKLPPFLTKDL